MATQCRKSHKRLRPNCWYVTAQIQDFPKQNQFQIVLIYFEKRQFVGYDLICSNFFYHGILQANKNSSAMSNDVKTTQLKTEKLTGFCFLSLPSFSLPKLVLITPQCVFMFLLYMYTSTNDVLLCCVCFKTLYKCYIQNVSLCIPFYFVFAQYCVFKMYLC